LAAAVGCAQSRSSRTSRTPPPPPDRRPPPKIVKMFFMGRDQGEQNERIFTDWMTLGRFVKMTQVRLTFWLLFAKFRLSINFTKNLLGYILGDLFANSPEPRDLIRLGYR
jgi:hypothetical protein